MVSTFSVRSLTLMAYIFAFPLQGCLLSTEPVPEDRYYRLQTLKNPTPLPIPKFPGIIEVERFVADGVTAGRPIVYSEVNTPNQLKEYHYHFWTEPPTIMLRDQLVSFLRHANIASSVVTPEMRVRSDFSLTGKIYRLERVLGKSSFAIIEMELSLRRPETGELILLRNYSHKGPSNHKGVAGAVSSLKNALSTIYSQFLKDLLEQKL